MTRVRPDWLEIGDPKAAAFLLDYPLLKLLEPFFGEARPVSSAARALGIDVRDLHYRVRRLEQMSLLEVVGTRPRRGRPMKLYRTTAAGFHVPFRLAPDALLPDFSRALAEPVQRALYRGLQAALLEAIPELPSWGMSIRHDALFGFQYFPAPGPGVPTLLERMTADPELPAASDRWHYLDLDHGDARAFEAELQAVVDRYRGHRGGQRYLVHAAIAPLLDGP